MESVIDFQIILNQYSLLPSCHRDQHGSNCWIDGDQRICGNSFSLWLVCLPSPQVSGDNSYANAPKLGQYLDMWPPKQLPFSAYFPLIPLSVLLHIYVKCICIQQLTAPVNAGFQLTCPASLPVTQFQQQVGRCPLGQSACNQFQSTLA